MKSKWPVVRLGEVLTHRKEFITIDDLAVYKRPRVQLHAQGLVLRDEVPGALIKTKKQQVCRAGEFLVAEIDAKSGGFGIVPPELDGAIVSSHYFLFVPDETCLDRSYLSYFSRTRAFRDQIEAQGSTNYAAIRPGDVLRYEMPLPPIEEQRQLVARFDALATVAAEARTLRMESLETAHGILRGEELRIWPADTLVGAPHLADVTTYLARGRQAEQGDSEHLLIKTQHVQQGRYLPTTLRLAPQAAARVHTDAIARNGDILVACSAAGCLGRVARFSAHALPASADTHVAIARPDPAIVEPEYLYAYLRSAQGQIQLRSRERGDWQREKVGFRLTELNLNDLRAVPVPVPPRAEQRRIVEGLSTLHRAMATLLDTLAEARTYTEALVPALLQRALAGQR